MSEETHEHDPSAPPPMTPEEEAMLEQQMREIRIEDILAQTVASLLNLSARRIVKEDEVDLDQARTGIDAVRLLKDLLPEEVSVAIQEPLSQVQLLYAQRAGITEADGASAANDPADTSGVPDEAATPPLAPTESKAPPPPGPKLWTPGRD